MATIYVASTETFVGKSATCSGLLRRAQRDGFSIGYLKPVCMSVKRTEEAALDEDAAFIKQQFGLTESLEKLSPVLLTQSNVEQVMRGQAPDYSRRLRDAYLEISRNKDFVVLEGANNWAEGAIVDLAADQVSDMLESPMMMINRYRGAHTVDTILATQRYLGSRLMGVIINQIPEPQLDYVKTKINPFLESHQVPVYALITQDTMLAGLTVADLYEHLGGQLIGQQDWLEQTVEHLMIGAMGADSALSHFRRRPHKAVFTGGDRADLQMTALETSTSVLVLTGNVRPIPQVIDRAEDRHVPIILLPDDTLSAVERAEQIFGHVRFKQRAKIDRFSTLFEQQFDFDRLYQALGIARSSKG